MSRAIELILEIERGFNQLKREYTLFLNDISKVEPLEMRDALVERVKQLRNTTGMRTEEQFRTNNLVSKIQSHIQLWERQLEHKYIGTGQKKPPQRKKKPTPKPRRPEQKGITIQDAINQRERVTELYDEYMRLNLLLGARKMINFGKFQNFIHNQTRKIQTAKQVDSVRYEVQVQDQKVVIKSKSVKKS